MDETTINYTIGILGLILAIIGLATSYYFYKKSLRIKEPVYSFKSNNLISGFSPELDGLKVFYKDEEVELLTVTKLLFYNRGEETITKQDIETKNYLRVIPKWGSIYDASVLQVNNHSNDFKINVSMHVEEIAIEFDYLDKNQGAVIQIVHFGSSSEDLQLTGDIKGVEKLEKALPNKFQLNKPMTLSDKRKLGAVSFVGVLGLYIQIFQKEVSASLVMVYPWFVGVFALVIFAFSWFIPIILLLWIITYVVQLFKPSNMIPEGLEKFLE